MKKIILPILALLALSVLPSCSEKFNVAAPYKSITIIYGILDRGDTAHYIRIQKAFLDDNKSALLMAKESDSSFFSNINVVMKKVNMTTGVVLADTTHLNRVDLTNEGYPKDSGTFFNSPNYAYKFKGTLDPNYIYRIVVTNSASGETDSAESPVIDNRPAAFYAYYIDDSSSDPQFDFASTNPSQSISIISRYNAPANFNFNGNTTPAGVAQLYIRFNWLDSNTANQTTVRRSYDYNLGYLELNPSSPGFQYKVLNTAMYNAIKSGMGTAPANTVRLIDRCELIEYLGTHDFYNYIRVEALQGTGLTGNEIQPTYTNIKGKNVLGLFAARAVRQGYVTISNNTIVQLRTLDLVANVRIVGTVYR